MAEIKRHWPELNGKDAEEAKTELEKEEHVERVDIKPEGHPMPLIYNPTSVWIFVDEDNKVKDIRRFA
ncbi:hypothetical protein WJX72_001056 [[Myrmecia] bisecta]|uniref:Uncharacterized protein n=1 Tax=[Myrmecia] bisecta TaxID=41462 RepID=A0AAW1R5T0_9CHLO